MLETAKRGCAFKGTGFAQHPGKHQHFQTCLDEWVFLKATQWGPVMKQ